MNRADQAPEPSIEELLASIRLIISDADKQGGPLPRESRSLSGPAGGYPASGATGEVSGDEIFDLTDELVFPEEGGRAQPGTPPAAARAQPGLDMMYAGQPPHLGPRRGSVPDAAQVLRPEVRDGTQGPGAATAPVWSRRELPPGAQAPSAPRLRQEPPTARPMARNWAGDIQMPVSEHGPVPLFPTLPGNSQPEAPAAEADGRADTPAEIEVQAAQPQGDGSAAVAVLAQSIARSAIGVLEARELEDATQVDFEHLDAGSKAEVAERFAAAIESVAQAVHDGQDEAFLTEVIDAQVFEPEPQKQPAVRNAGALAPAKETAREVKTEAPAPRPEAPAKETAREVKAEAPAPQPEAPAKAAPWEVKAVAPAPRPGAPARAEAPAKAEVRTKPEVEVQAPAQPAPEPVAAAVVKPETPASVSPAKASAAPTPVAAQPLAQAQFMGAAQAPVAAQTGGPLETAVREMLRPLLVQWLNENMPRILENAIRDEIAVRGLLPKSDS
jgi:cell pole-organizing protein PopZ